MSRPAFDRVQSASLPASLAALCCTAEAQAHPWLLGFLKNVTQRLLTAECEAGELRSELSIVYRRLAKLERCNHDA
jgi:hypothetical protein